jgi:hypothetical protein
MGNTRNIEGGVRPGSAARAESPMLKATYGLPADTDMSRLSQEQIAELDNMPEEERQANLAAYLSKLNASSDEE